MTTFHYIIDYTFSLLTLCDLFTFADLRHGFLNNHGTNYTLMLTLKTTMCLSFLILIRGGVPRYRYDFLTKIGWVKFLGYVLTVFILTVALFII